MKERFKKQTKRIKEVWIVLLFFVLAILLYSSIFILKFNGLRSSDQMDYAQMARHLSKGEGFITSLINPLSLAFNNSVENHPNFWRPPMFPLVLSVLFHLFGSRDSIPILLSGFFFIILIPLVYIFARDVFNRRVGLWAGAITLTSLIFLDYSMTGLVESMFIFLFTLSLYLLYKKANTFYIGSLLGFCYLTRYNTLFLIPGFLWFIYKTYPTWKKEIIKLLAIFVIVISPWLIRNFNLTGNPLFSLQKYEFAMHTDIFREHTLYRVFEPVDPIKFILSHPLSILKKAFFGTIMLFLRVATLMHNFFVTLLGTFGFFYILIHLPLEIHPYNLQFSKNPCQAQIQSHESGCQPAKISEVYGCLA